jgi:hypothetical protein
MYYALVEISVISSRITTPLQYTLATERLARSNSAPHHALQFEKRPLRFLPPQMTEITGKSNTSVRHNETILREAEQRSKSLSPNISCETLSRFRYVFVSSS